jgi:hypothetical protein
MFTNQDLEKYKKAVQGIEARLNELSPEERQAFSALKVLFANGNYEATESGGYIRVFKENLSKHSKNRILLIHLKNFIEMCDKRFTNKAVVQTVERQVIQPPTIQPSVEPSIAASETNSPHVTRNRASENNNKVKSGNHNMIILGVVAVLLIVGWYSYKNWDEKVKPLLESWGVFAVEDRNIDILDEDGTNGSIKKTIAKQPAEKNSIKEIKSDGQSGKAEDVQGSKNYSFGKYVGNLRNNIPEGNGTLTYSRSVQIAKHDTGNPHYAEAGDKFVGSWGNGDIVSGVLYSSDGSEKEKIRAPKRFNPYDISKD